MTDAQFKDRVRQIKDPLKMLEAWLEFMRCGPIESYYIDIGSVLTEQTDQIITERKYDRKRRIS